MIYSYAPGSAAAHYRSVALPGAPLPQYRIVVPMRKTRPSEVKRLPQLMRLKFELDLETLDYPGRYAVAEELTTATLVESVSVRFVLADGRRGVAIWRDWRWWGALLRGGGGAITLEHLEAIVTGAPWPPPAIGCPRCGAQVRKNADGTPRAHGKKRRCKGYWIDLRNGLPIYPSERIAG